MTEPVIRRIPVDPANPYPLGRHVNFDPRSRAFPFAARDEAAAQVVSRPAWTRRVEVFNQGDLGSCTGNAAAGWLVTDDASRLGVTAIGAVPVDEEYAVGLYSAATAIDPYPGRYPPDDTGSDGTSVASVLKTRGLVDSYTHAFGGLNDVLAALQSGPVLLGTSWYDSMFDVTPDGEVRITPDARVAGGHEYLADGELDTTLERVWFTNSWGTSWGRAGRAWLSYDTLTRLLAEDGDATILHPVTVTPGPGPMPPFPPTPSGCLSVPGKALRGVLGMLGSRQRSG